MGAGVEEGRWEACFPASLRQFKNEKGRKALEHGVSLISSENVVLASASTVLRVRFG